jgi:hypothetical protein
MPERCGAMMATSCGQRSGNRISGPGWWLSAAPVCKVTGSDGRRAVGPYPTQEVPVAALDPATHGFVASQVSCETWMPATSLDKPGRGALDKFGAKTPV